MTGICPPHQLEGREEGRERGGEGTDRREEGGKSAAGGLGAGLGQHLAGGDEVVVGQGGYLEDGIPQGRGAAEPPNHVFLTEAELGAHVKRQHHGARAGGGDGGDAAQHGGDAGGLADVAANVVQSRIVPAYGL